MKNKDARKALLIGTLCSLSYLAVYYERNILSAVSPQILEEGVFSTERLGILSTVYCITYAVGQLVNGVLGDRIKGVYMISGGLVIAAIANLLFISWPFPDLAYGIVGFSLAMVYAPMTKLVSENTEMPYTARCTLGYTLASLLGSPIAGIVAMFLSWKMSFLGGSIALVVMAICFWQALSHMEKKGIIQYNRFPRKTANRGGVDVLLKRQILRYTLVAVLTGVVRTTVVFWLPVYTSQQLGYSSEQASLIFTVATFLISLSAFLAVGIYAKLQNILLAMRIMFTVSALAFGSQFLLQIPILNITMMVIAIIASNTASSILWSIYCPSLRDTGMVSTATGFLDFMSYMAAAISSTVFGNAVSTIGWNNLILIWFGLMVCGVLTTFGEKYPKKYISKEYGSL